MNSTNIWHVLFSKSQSKLLSDASLLLLRLWLGQEFLFAGWTKLSGGLGAPDWFVHLRFPFPHMLLGGDANWLAAGSAELVLGAALVLGLGTRIAALGLLYITYVAVYSVHFDLGWAGWNQIETDAGNGFKVPLMMAVMLLAVLSQGAGRLSADFRWFEVRASGGKVRSPWMPPNPC